MTTYLSVKKPDAATPPVGPMYQQQLHRENKQEYRCVRGCGHVMVVSTWRDESSTRHNMRGREPTNSEIPAVEIKLVPQLSPVLSGVVNNINPTTPRPMSSPLRPLNLPGDPVVRAPRCPHRGTRGSSSVLLPGRALLPCLSKTKQ